MTPTNITATELTPDAFAPYGDVMTAPSTVERLHFAADLANLRPGAKLNLSMVRTPIVNSPLHISELEQHPFSAQAFVPLDVESYLVVVALNDKGNQPLLWSLKAFVARPDQCICYRPKIWHIGMASLQKAGSFALLVYEDRTPDDCLFLPVPMIQIRFEATKAAQ